MTEFKNRLRALVPDAPDAATWSARARTEAQARTRRTAGGVVLASVVVALALWGAQAVTTLVAPPSLTALPGGPASNVPAGCADLDGLSERGNALADPDTRFSGGALCVLAGGGVVGSEFDDDDLSAVVTDVPMPEPCEAHESENFLPFLIGDDTTVLACAHGRSIELTPEQGGLVIDDLATAHVVEDIDLQGRAELMLLNPDGERLWLRAAQTPGGYIFSSGGEPVREWVPSPEVSELLSEVTVGR